MPIKNANRDIMANDKTVCDVVDAWFQKWFHNTPGISDNSIIINRCLQAKDDLVAILRYEVPSAPATENKKKED